MLIAEFPYRERNALLQHGKLAIPAARDAARPTIWQDDQSVLNTAFAAPRYHSLAPRFNFNQKQGIVSPCGLLEPTRAAIVHYIGRQKPWSPVMYFGDDPAKFGNLNTAMAWMAHRTNPLWWRWYLADKTVVVGAGPSLVTRARLDTVMKVPAPRYLRRTRARAHERRLRASCGA